MHTLHSPAAATLVVTLGLLIPCMRAPAQTSTVSPRGFDLVPGGNTTGYPWGYVNSQYFHYQQVHDDVAGLPRVLLGIAVRRKEGGSTQWPAISPELEVSLSSNGLSSQNASATFTANHGQDLKVVMAKKIVNFPAVNAPGSLPAPFTYRMLFDMPFIYLGQGSICYEIVMTSNTHTSGSTLNLDLAQNNLAVHRPYGSACGGTTLTGGYTAPNLVQTAAGLAPSVPAVAMIGIANDAFGGLPLPIDLTPLGASGCSLYLVPLLYVAGTSNAGGTATWSFDVSMLPPDLQILVQAFAPSPANALGVVFTNGLLTTQKVPQTFTRNWTSSSAATAGSLQKIYALVTRFIQP